MVTLAAIAAPPMLNYVDFYRLGMSERDVERELQFARLKSVSSNTPMRVRFGCPAAGQLRVVELIGTKTNPDPADADTNLARCSESTYPYRPTGADQSRLTRPNNDGAIRYLQSGVTLTASQTLEFWADGTVHALTNGVAGPALGDPGATITLSKNSKTKNIQVNGLGKIRMDR